MFINKATNDFNKDLRDYDLSAYLELTKDFKSSFPEFKVIEREGFKIIDESQACEVGYKARSGEFFIQKLVEEGVKEIVYVQPRRGFAGISLSWLCKKYGLDLTLVMPASKEVSPHQLYCIELGAKPLFLRIAAMPNANSMAKKYAEATGAYYVPLGLAHPYVVAGGVRAIYDYFKEREHPSYMWTVISTGVLARSLQIALPMTDFTAIAVSRNIQQGELGRAEFGSYHKAFTAKSDFVPDFDCEPYYDAKGYDVMRKHGLPGDWFFSVAGEAPKPTISPSTVDSYRDWNDRRDFKFIL